MPHLDRSCVPFEPLGASERGDSRRQCFQSSRTQLLDRDHFYEVRRGQSTAQTSLAGRRQHVVGPEA